MRKGGAGSLSITKPALFDTSMVAVLAALGEELGVALGLCTNRRRVRRRGIRLWQASYGSRSILFLKTGAGPARAARSLDGLLSSCKPDALLVIGYAGALDPELKIGDLVVAIRARSMTGADYLETDPGNASHFGGRQLDFNHYLIRIGKHCGASIRCGDVLTAPAIVGDPLDKRRLHRSSRASVVDMETAALARVAREAGLPIGCVRVVSDEADDDFLIPFSGKPGRAALSRAAGAAKGYIQWKAKSAAARASLRRYLRCYFDAL